MKNFENNLQKLDKIIEEIDRGASLTNSLKHYKDGISLVSDCVEDLSAFESEVKILRIEDGKLTLEDFRGEGDGFSD